MKHLKMLGLAFAAAAALMALAGTGTASAGGVLCKEQNPVCANKYAINTVFDFSLKAGTSSRFKLTDGTQIKACGTSTWKSELTANPDASAEATTKNTELIFEKGCETTTTKLGKLRFQNISGNWNGTVFADETIEITTIILTTCTYKIPAGHDIGEIKEGKPATLVINTVITTEPPDFCPPTLVWTAEYTLTQPANETLAVSPK